MKDADRRRRAEFSKTHRFLGFLRVAACGTRLVNTMARLVSLTAGRAHRTGPLAAPRFFSLMVSPFTPQMAVACASLRQLAQSRAESEYRVAPDFCFRRGLRLATD